MSLHGRAGAPRAAVERVAALEAAHAAALESLPEATRALFWARHEAASAEAGGGRWALPRLIAISDEPAWRARVAAASGCD